MIVLPRKYFTHLLSKISIKHVFSTIFSTVVGLLQTVYRETDRTTTGDKLIVFIDEKLSRALDRIRACSLFLSRHKHFLVAGAKKAKSHINRCLVTLLPDVVLLLFI